MRNVIRTFFGVALCALLLPAPALAQGGAQVSMGIGDHDSDAPIEITSEDLQVDQQAGTAIFSGDVILGQGAMRMTSDRLVVEYGDNPTTGEAEITRMTATGGVTIISGEEAAEAQRAVYTLANTTIVMTGDVLLTQGPSALAGDTFTYNVETGAGQMSGRVKTILRTGNN